MRVAVLGTGMIGTTVVNELVKFSSIESVIAVDGNAFSVEKCLEIANNSKAIGKVASLQTEEDISKVLDNVDIAVACLPHSLSLPAIKAAISAKCHLVDLVGSNFEEKIKLDQQAKEAGVIFFTRCGVAPGINNFFASPRIEFLYEADEAVIVFWGSSTNPVPPFLF